MWASGDYPSVAELIELAALDLVEAAEIKSGVKLLDVATGSGNVAILAAKKGAKVTGVDLAPELFQAARKRATQAKVKVDWVEGDAEDLQIEDASFDRVLSAFGVMFAPRHRRAAGELARLLRPGGLIGLCSWTPQGVGGQMDKIGSAYLPPPPEYALQPTLWGEEKHVRELFAPSRLELSFERRNVEINHESPEGYLKFLEESFGPIIVAKQTLNDQEWKEMRAELLDLFTHVNESEDGLSFKQEYLRVIGRSQA
jgi:ubiquinone/menaquinone biosynthesis C-methylase UbiE